MTLSDACLRADFFLRKDEQNYKLKQNHAHWYQVQGQLLISGAPYCDFVTYTKQEFNIERIYPHETTMKTLLEKLYSFYTNHFKSYYANINEI